MMIKREGNSEVKTNNNNPSDDKQGDNYLTLREVRELLRVSETTLKQYRKDFDFGEVRLAGKILIPRERVAAFIKQHRKRK